MAITSKLANVVKINVLQRRKVFDLKPNYGPPPKRRGKPSKDCIGRADLSTALPANIYIGGLSDCFFALFAHIGQKEGCNTVYRRLTKFEVTVKGPSWTMNTARTFLWLAAYFQRVWWYANIRDDYKLEMLGRVPFKDILLAAPSVFKNPIHANILARHQRDVEVIAKTTMTLRDLESGEIYKKFADVPILTQWNAVTDIHSKLERHDGYSVPRPERHDGYSHPNWNAVTDIHPDEAVIIDEIFAIGKNNREEYLYKSIGKLNSQPGFSVNYVGGALMRLQRMTGGRGKYKLQAFDCELPTDHRKMAEYLSAAFFSAWRNIGNEKRVDRNFSFETYAAIIGMASSLKNYNRQRIIKVLNQTAPYFCSCWAVEDNTLKFVMSRTSNRKQDF